ncbi:hypothetical protein D6C78_10326 [Aureobasidium pullulans]|uniref:Cyclin-dependent kinase n=1 Tax=Aureobasidium pullulans TaxID=5580 RepID=A0A4S9HI67_AURPU|nr:hypothetical protein D6D23_07694 [Aureobasidium pullulans]THX23145.1 hypothetical protein D6D12_08628 [Aureobasidium pullulans]THX45514.1 hypothetical protein D6D11_07340 [Aureobasidium pullulans]THX71824.1 hypothetical protein D6D08_05423 [Aureobasidium pullulans]THX73209.1 hypothetical protein D6D04_08657 [Aureobasidium pullulans]
MAEADAAGNDVANRVMRRLEVSKMTRALQDRLALANVKIKHGWENLSIDTIEPHIDQQLKRKRPASSINDSYSDTSSSVSSRFHSVGGMASSPLTAPIFSDDMPRLGSSHSSLQGSTHSSKRPRFADVHQYPASSSQTGRKTRSALAVQSWKRSHRLPESSPAYHNRTAIFPSTLHVPKLSFISEGSSLIDDAPSPELSEDDDTDLPVHSFNVGSDLYNIHSSPPKTPPPQHRFSRTPKDGDEAHSLILLYPSPTPANGVNSARVLAPSTPPSKTTPLPSSMMQTPGGSNGLFGFALNTPSNNFNFADFCNVTPSPAQAKWSASKSPLSARESHRKLNFDGLLQPGSSPEVTKQSTARENGGTLELGALLQ